MKKQRWEESEKRKEEERRSEKRKSQRKEDAGAWKGSKAAIHYVFPMICGTGGSKSRLAKAAGAEPSGQMRDEKVHAVVARSTFRSQNVQIAPCSEHFWKLRCWKSARCCGAKHMSKSKVLKTDGLRPLSEVEMMKKCTPLSLWHEAHVQVKMYKAHHSRSTFGSWVSKKCTPLWHEAHVQVKMYKAHHSRTTFEGSDVFLRGRHKGFCTFAKSEQNVGVLWHFQKRCQAWDIWRGSGKMHAAWQGAIQETCSSEMLGGPGADFLRRVAFWSIRSSGLLRWFCVTRAALHMTGYHFFVAGAAL